jgi:uncharacterized lipoprotein
MKKTLSILLIAVVSLTLFSSCSSYNKTKEQALKNSQAADKANSMMNSSFDRSNSDGFFD